jgi:hypothetical protein
MTDFTFTAPPSVPANRKIVIPKKSSVPSEQRAAIMESLKPRTIAQPVKNDVPADVREGVLEDIEPRKFARPGQETRSSDRGKPPVDEKQAEVEQMQENADMNTAFDEAARAMTEALVESIELFPPAKEIRRKKHVGELTAALHSMIQLIRQKNQLRQRAHFAKPAKSNAKPKAKLRLEHTPVPFVDDDLIRLDAHALARAWETQVWCRSQEQCRGFEGYVQQMDMDIIDLEMWMDNFDSELNGYEIFYNYFYRFFGSEQKKYLTATVLSKETEGASLLGVATGGAPLTFAAGTMQVAPCASTTPSIPLGVDEMDFQFNIPSTTFGAAVTESFVEETKTQPSDQDEHSGLRKVDGT